MEQPGFRMRGVVITPEDLTLEDWPERAKRAGLTTIGLHPTPSVVSAFVQSDRGRQFVDRCRALGLQVEYELHAMRELLPREMFYDDPALFREDEKGQRNPDANLCVHSDRALDLASQSALAIPKTLKPTTNRFYFWGDDGAGWCRCERCRDYSDSDQALMLENHLVAALRHEHRGAQLAHLAYLNTLQPPRRVKPHPGVFLEFAPIQRHSELPLTDESNRPQLEALDANLKVFGAGEAQVLEYCLDLSRYSHWKRPAPKMPFDTAIFAADAEAYQSRGIRQFTTFAVFLDAEYVQRYGDPPLADYGRILRARDLTTGSTGDTGNS